MTRSAIRLSSVDGDALSAAIAAIRAELGLSAAFPPEVDSEAAAAVATRQLPERDLVSVPFVTIDPAGATDLDQALHIERLGDGYRVLYAIADVPAFVAPLGAVDAEARRRGQTLYAPDGRVPLHPTVISEDAASLLPDAVRGAFVWEFELGADTGVLTSTVSRARIRSVRQLSYADAQRELDEGTAAESVALLEPVGLGRIALERERGGASLARPEQLVDRRDGEYVLERRVSLPVENWNAQISLLTGMAAARLMIDGGIGILRTMPSPQPDTVARFRLQAEALGRAWPEDMPYGEYLKSLDSSKPRELAITYAATSLFRGAGYTAFDGQAPAESIQAAVGAPYAHVTAPLRRLVDRFALLVCEALCAGREPEPWIRDALPTLARLMSASDSLASRLDSRSIAAVEAALLVTRVGDEFDASVISAKEKYGVVQLVEPPIEAECRGALTPGARVRVRVVRAEIATGTVLFELA